MRRLSPILACWWMAVALFVPGAGAASPADPVGAELRRLAARASKRGARPLLRKYAAATSDPERRGLALFVLGYREFEAELYPNAAEDLREAARTKFSLTDYAEYYSAAAADKAGQAGQPIETLEGFDARHPESPLRAKAAELLARACLANAQPERAVQVLAAAGRAREVPSLALLLAQAYWQGQNFDAAARAFQEVYYAFPAAPESTAAAEPLRRLEAQLGASFPPASDEIRSARAEILFNKSQVSKALEEYDLLLAARPASPLAERWKLARARCLLGLKRTLAAVEALEGLVSTSAEVDAERLAMLVDADGRLADQGLMLRELDQLRAHYPQSPSYAAALGRVASFFARRGDRENALKYDQMAAENFPEAELGREGNWRVAWAYYLARQDEKASEAMLGHLERYPASPHGQAALYWLGRIAEEGGKVSDARAAYQFLNRHFGQSFYAVLARQRLAGLGRAVTEKASDSPLTASLTRLEQALADPPTPSLRLCAPAEPDETLRRSSTLRGLGLDSLAEENLDAEVAAHPESPHLLLALSKLKAEKREFSAALAEVKRVVPNAAEYQFSGLTEEIWGLLYPQAFRKLVEQQARANGIKPYLVMGLIRQESSFNPQATSWADARGLMQILPQTAGSTARSRRVAGRKLYDPAFNVRFGCRYLRGLLEIYQGSPERALAAYHAGTPNVKTWLEGREFREPGEFVEAIPIPATRVYVEAVLRDAEIYRQLMGRTVKFRKCS